MIKTNELRAFQDLPYMAKCQEKSKRIFSKYCVRSFSKHYFNFSNTRQPQDKRQIRQGIKTKFSIVTYTNPLQYWLLQNIQEEFLHQETYTFWTNTWFIGRVKWFKRGVWSYVALKKPSLKHGDGLLMTPWYVYPRSSWHHRCKWHNV